jgi:4-aminobutyrate aminotransferase
LGDDDDSAVAWALDGLQRVFDRLIAPTEVATMLIEPVQGEGGYVVPPAQFLRSLRRICDEHGILLILDEVQTGFGRTGQMFAAQTFDVQPDIMCIAKGIANGFPLSATVSSRALMGKWLAGAHGTTFGGNPIACAAALATLEVIQEENLLANCREMGSRLLAGFRELQRKHAAIGDVRGVGLMVAMELIVPGQGENPEPGRRDGCVGRLPAARAVGLHGRTVWTGGPFHTAAECDRRAGIRSTCHLGREPGGMLPVASLPR